MNVNETNEFVLNENLQNTLRFNVFNMYMNLINETNDLQN